ncbi:hypothetical protein E2562_010111 [Oryza meyeriana var. granulata]|uniref:Uncharacterized protein n=1 Tax=Oryza meyeriana var. granulata TaxID=110450 RepID=A0A6G1EJ67_9ORYZ|nr:hypothetical protein E2562_010111 [Oryza meyeriana var. granulata]
MDSAFKSLSSSAKSPSFMASKQYYSVNHQPSKTPSFPQPPALPQPPLLPLPVHLHAPPQHPAWPASRPVQRAKKPRHAAVAAPSPKKTTPEQAQGASAPIPVAAPPKKRTAACEQEAVEWTTTTDSLYSVSPPPSCVPMPTSLLVSAAGRKAPTACAVEVASGGGGVDVGATDELRRLLRL